VFAASLSSRERKRHGVAEKAPLRPGLIVLAQSDDTDRAGAEPAGNGNKAAPGMRAQGHGRHRRDSPIPADTSARKVANSPPSKATAGWHLPRGGR